MFRLFWRIQKKYNPQTQSPPLNLNRIIKTNLLTRSRLTKPVSAMMTRNIIILPFRTLIPTTIKEILTILTACPHTPTTLNTITISIPISIHT